MTLVRNDVAVQRTAATQDRQAAEAAPSNVPFEVLVGDVRGREGRSQGQDAAELESLAEFLPTGTAADLLALSNIASTEIAPAPVELPELLVDLNADGGAQLKLTGSTLSFLEAGPLILRELMDKFYDPLTEAALEALPQPKAENVPAVLKATPELQEPVAELAQQGDDIAQDARTAVFEARGSAAAVTATSSVRASTRMGRTSSAGLRAALAPGQSFAPAAQGYMTAAASGFVATEEVTLNEMSEAHAIRAELIDAMGEGHLSELSLSVTRGETGLIVQIGVPSLDARQQKLLEQRLTSLIESHGRSVERFSFESDNTPTPEFNINPTNERIG